MTHIIFSTLTRSPFKYPVNMNNGILTDKSIRQLSTFTVRRPSDDMRESECSEGESGLIHTLPWVRVKFSNNGFPFVILNCNSLLINWRKKLFWVFIRSYIGCDNDTLMLSTVVDLPKLDILAYMELVYCGLLIHLFIFFSEGCIVTHGRFMDEYYHKKRKVL